MSPRSCRARWVAATTTLALAISLSADDSKLPWEGTRWTVNCTPELEQAIAESTLGMGVPDVCDPGSPVSAAAAARHELQTASAWLRDVGFGGPRVSERDEGIYVARLDNFGVSLADACDKERATFSPITHVLRLSPCFHFAFVTPDNLGAFHNRGALLGLAPVHELFHAVQLGYAGMNTARFARWIVEGTAQLVEVASARRAGTPRPEPRSILRYYDSALHVPIATPEVGRDSSEWQIWAYGTWFFWDFLGEHLKSPNRIEYLDTVFRQNLVDDNNGLSGVDAGLKALGTKGLYDLYPEFVAARLDEPCFFENLGAFARTAAGAPCMTTPSARGWIDLKPGDRRRVTVNPGEMATGAFVVRTSVPDSRIGRLRVQIPKEDDDPAYHLVVGNTRVDVETMGQFPFGERNRFLGTVPGGRGQALVKVANVPEEIANVSGDEGLTFGPEIPVEVELDVVQGVVTFSGGVTGSYDIRDRTIFGVTLGPGGSCGVNLWLTSQAESGDSVNLVARLAAPLRAGRFPVVFALGNTSLGTVNVASHPGHDRPGRSGFMHPELATGGMFEIVRLNPESIEGRLRASVPAQGKSAGAHVVDAHFVAQLGGWVGAPRREAHPCLPR